MNELETDIIDFIVNNREDILQYIHEQSVPAINMSRIFDGYPDLQDEYIDQYQLNVFYSYLKDHFIDLNYETFSLHFNAKNVKIYLES